VCDRARRFLAESGSQRARGKDQALLTARTNLRADYIESVVRHGLRSMPPFVPSDLTDMRLKALAAFLAK
jgi:hypothetical protein